MRHYSSEPHYTYSAFLLRGFLVARIVPFQLAELAIRAECEGLSGRAWLSVANKKRQEAVQRRASAAFRALYDEQRNDTVGRCGEGEAEGEAEAEAEGEGEAEGKGEGEGEQEAEGGEQEAERGEPRDDDNDDGEQHEGLPNAEDREGDGGLQDEERERRQHSANRREGLDSTQRAGGKMQADSAIPDPGGQRAVGGSIFGAFVIHKETLRSVVMRSTLGVGRRTQPAAANSKEGLLVQTLWAQPQLTTATLVHRGVLQNLANNIYILYVALVVSGPAK